MKTTQSKTFLARQIAKARKDSGFSQEGLAYRIRDITNGDLTPAATDISRYERGVYSPRTPMLAAIAQVTGKDIEFFVNESSEAEDDAEAALRKLAATALELGRYDMVADLLALAKRESEKVEVAA